MTIEWMLAKYIPDVQRNEPVNVGVVLRYNDETLCKFVGENAAGNIDGRKTGTRFASPEAYKLWVKHWRSAIRNAPSFQKLSESRRGGDNYYLEPGGQFMIGNPEAGPNALLAELFELLVDKDDAAAPDVLQLSERAIRTLPMAKEIQRDSDILVHHAGGEDELRFHYRYDNGRPHLMQRVNLSPDARTWDRVHSMTWSFEKVVAAEDPELKESQCIALVKYSSEESAGLHRQLGQLSRLAQVVNVGDVSSAQAELLVLLEH
ncbi:hypothetical protein [Paractinoplanes lichenicola]|uniref:Uncharacterized protein n=1 Tax=Paractinoplanes lichenicola TaxID=2802976 RepID=A0ABS1W3Q3_9ACTN|nr:hypothetical protein [Actinoplanes lichenicola]MBL7261366.1 hypothetical protein [Actinoplanes lichenicola]